jgi:AbrB family looped-hinge helix DNA binding protein
MAITSKVTSQGQISVPVEVRKQLGLTPGSILEWTPAEGGMMVKRRGEYTFEDIRKALFPNGPPKRISLKQMKQAIGRDRAAKDARVMREWEEDRREGR